MLLPVEVPVMTLTNVILFPQAMLPLYIFEPRYRKMLAESLTSHRMFAVAMQKPGRTREIPSNVAGLGLVRAAVTNKDGTSHLVLQGVSRVALGPAMQYKPFRLHKIKPLETTGTDSVVVDALSAKVLDLVAERFEKTPKDSISLMPELPAKEKLDLDKNPVAGVPLQNIMKYLSRLDDPDQLADLVSCTLLRRATERQTILETTNLEERLKQLIHFLMAQLEDSPNTSDS